MANSQRAGARARRWTKICAILKKIPLDIAATWRAGMAFRQYRRKDSDDPVLLDFFIRAQAAMLNLPHLTNDHRRTKTFPDVDFEFV
jgi:predicted nucleic acid-binding protein